MTEPQVFFASTFKGYFFDSLCRLSDCLGARYLEIDRLLQCAPVLPSAANFSNFDRYSIVCPFNAPDTLSCSFLDFIRLDIIHDLNIGKCRLFLDNSNERCDADKIRAIEGNLVARGVKNMQSITVICQDRQLAKQVSVNVLPHDFFIVRCSDKLKKNILPYLNINQRPSRLFLCLNATPRPIRVLTLIELMQANLWGPNSSEDCCSVSFPGFEYAKGKGLNLDHLHKIMLDRGYSKAGEMIEWISSNSPFLVDDSEEVGNELADIIDVGSYSETLASIVTETECLPGVVRVTEKTFKAYALGHLPIIVGNRHSLKMSKEFGFQIFSDVLKHEYDNEDDMLLRVKSCIRAAMELRNLTKVDADAYKLIREIGKVNISWAIEGFSTNYAKKWTQPILRSVAFMD